MPPSATSTPPVERGGFSIPAPSAAEATTSTSSVALGQVRSGTLDREGYVRLHVEQATAHLQGLPMAANIRSMLAEHVEADPFLKALVDKALER
jgi:hypothetical protein